MTGPLTGRRPRPSLRRALLLAVALAGPGLPIAAGAQPAPPAAEPTEGRPLEVLLEHRESLALTSDQLSQLNGVRDRLARANEPLVNRMMTLRREWQQQRVASRRATSPENTARLEQIRATAESTRAQIQENNRRAMQAVNRMLTRGQRTRLRTLVDERRRLDGTAPARKGANTRVRD